MSILKEWDICHLVAVYKVTSLLERRKTLRSLMTFEESSREARELDFSLRSHTRKPWELIWALALGQPHSPFTSCVTLTRLPPLSKLHWFPSPGPYHLLLCP